MSDSARPNADEWDVGVIWLTRSLQRPDRMLRRRWRAVRPGERSSKEELRAATDSLDVLDGCLEADSIAGLVAVLVVVALFVVLMAFGPGLLAITLGVFELGILLASAIAGVAGRVLFRQPWEIVARNGDEQHEWRIRGMREARHLVAEVTTALRLGSLPEDIAASHRDHNAPDFHAVPDVYRSNEFRLLGRTFGAVLSFAILLGVVFLVVR